MADSPLISIVTVAFNAEKEIGKTLASIKRQTFNDFEYLVIDGASSDNTLGIVDSFKIPQALVISESDRGLYDAMNKGLARAKGKYVLFLNAGDSFHSPDTLQQYAEAAENNADIIYGDTIIVNAQGDCLGPRHLSAPASLTKKSFSDGMLICHQAFMVKKDLAPQYDLAYRYSADYDWCVKCIANSSPEKCHNLKEVVIDYLSDGLTDKNKKESLKERFIIMKKHYGIIPTVAKHIGFIFRALKRGKL